jgi:hypothetical protein
LDLFLEESYLSGLDEELSRTREVDRFSVRDNNGDNPFTQQSLNIAEL